MTTEEKAKAYDEALEAARDELKQDLHESGVWAIQRIFPELRTSEDEMIRKYIINFVKLEKGVNLPPDDADRMLAYLEKQHEQKPENQKESKPVKWSKDDEEMLNRILYRLNDWDIIKTAQGFETDHRLPSPIKWLKNKFKSIREQ